MSNEVDIQTENKPTRRDQGAISTEPTKNKTVSKLNATSSTTEPPQGIFSSVERSRPICICPSHGSDPRCRACSNSQSPRKERPKGAEQSAHNAIDSRNTSSVLTTAVSSSKERVNQVQRSEERETSNTRKPTSNSVVNRATACSSTTSPSPGHAGGSRESTPNAPVNQTTTSVPTASIPPSREAVNVAQRREERIHRREGKNEVTIESASDSVVKQDTEDGPTARVLSRKKEIFHWKDECTCADTILCSACKINTSYVYLCKQCV